MMLNTDDHRNNIMSMQCG